MNTPIRSNRKEAGHRAEEAACAYLQGLGYAVIVRNWRCRTGEIDLISRDGETLVFVEVRSRTAPSRYGTAIEAINSRKCRQVRETAQVYLHMNGSFGISVRFDVVAVTFGKDGSIGEMKHVPGAF